MRTKPSWLYLWSRNPHNVARLRRVRNHFNLWFGYTLISFAAFVAVAYHVGTDLYDKVVIDARREGYAQALTVFEARHKQRLASDQDYINQICTQWWFNMSGTERTLENKGKRK